MWDSRCQNIIKVFLKVFLLILHDFGYVCNCEQLDKLVSEIIFTTPNLNYLFLVLWKIRILRADDL